MHVLLVGLLLTLCFAFGMAISQINVSTPTNQIVFTDTALGGATADGVKASSATVYWVAVDNSANAAATYVKLWNLTSGSVTVGTTAPDEIIYVPSNARVIHNLSSAGGSTPGKVFGTGLTVAAVTTGGTAGNTSPGTPVTVSIAYQ